MNIVRNLTAVCVLAGFTVGCGLPVPFEWSSEPATANVDDLLGDNTFNVPDGEDAAAAREMMERYFAEFADSDAWPDELSDLKLDVPLLESFPVDLTENAQVASAAETLSAVAIDRLELQFLQNSVNYAIPSFHFFTVNDGVTLPEADAFDMSNLPEGVKQRIIMVRSMVGDPHEMLFDDANAKLDVENDNLLLDWVKQHKGTLKYITYLSLSSEVQGGSHDWQCNVPDLTTHKKRWERLPSAGIQLLNNALKIEVVPDGSSLFEVAQEDQLFLVAMRHAVLFPAIVRLRKQMTAQEEN